MQMNKVKLLYILKIEMNIKNWWQTLALKMVKAMRSSKSKRL